uniref:Androgen dependent TFPI regulating protein n=3 Tax=Pongo abelii TaxID=9601 RepID=A0A8I5TNE4_PONAB|nr:androgen-dependent TFPI-regulating protein isoform X1 [Pongo abelii]
MTKTSTCIYRFLVLSWYTFLNYYISQEGKDEVKSEILANGARWKYMTLLNLLLQTIFYGVTCLDDVLKRTKGRKDIKFLTAFRDLLFTTLAFPVSTFVFLAFWILFLYNRDLIYPKVLDTIIPVWLNHAMHTFIFPITLAEVILRPHSYPSKKTGLTLLAAASIAYISRTMLLFLLKERGLLNTRPADWKLISVPSLDSHKLFTCDNLDDPPIPMCGEVSFSSVLCQGWKQRERQRVHCKELGL